MQTYDVGHFKVDIEVSGTGPFKAVGFLRPHESMEPLNSVIAEGATESEAVSSAREKASLAAAKMSFDPRYRRHID